LLLPGAADLLGIQACVVGVGEHLLERQPRLVEAPGPGERLDVPERARRGRAFRAAHPSGLASGLYRWTSESDTRLAVSASRVDSHLASVGEMNLTSGISRTAALTAWLPSYWTNAWRSPSADYSLPAADAHPVWRRRLSIRRRAGLRSVLRAGRVCPRYVLPLGYERYDARVRCLAQSPIATLAGPDFRPGVLAGPRCLASRDQVSARETSRYGQLQGRSSVCAPPGPTPAGRSWGRPRA
jgi:hypothetical protein